MKSLSILIRFEDSYGCKTLFERSQSILLDNADIQGSLGNTGVFDIAKKEVENYDYVVAVFDMDDPINYSLTGKSLLKNMKRKCIDSNGGVKLSYSNKLILIPVFFCYESLLFYYDFVKRHINSVQSDDTNQTIRLINLYKKYFDYGNNSIEVYTNIVNIIDQIQKDVYSITNSSSTKKWYPQAFHEGYYKAILKDIFSGLGIQDKKFSKHEDEIFNMINNNPQIGFSIKDWIQDIIKNARLNKYYANLLSLKSLADLNGMTIRHNLNEIINDINDYNTKIRGLNVRSVNECICNIKEYISYNVKNIVNECKNNGYTDQEIEQACRLLGVDI